MPSTEEALGVKKARFIYNKPDNYTPVYVSGVYGGLTPRGELLCHFFIEYSDLPAEEAFEVKNNDLVQESKEITHRHDREENEVVFQRDVRTGLIIPAHHLQSIINWMQDKLDKLKEAQRQYQEEMERAKP